MDGEEGRSRRLVGATGRGLRRAGSATGRGASYTVRQARRASHAEGAGDSGLYRLIELHAFNAAGDAAVAISLAGTLFFAQPGEARGPIALFLGLTMLPFAVVAPLLGPFLDRFSHGRRWAIGATMALRAFFCWLMADAVASQSLLMYPTALGVLVSSKAYGVARAATVPRLQPASLTLVKANSRISLAGVVGAAISAPLAGGASYFGAQWSLRYAFVVFAGATILSILLPARADATGDELPVSLGGESRKFKIPADVGFALRCNAGLRMLSGFLTMYMAFLLRDQPFPGWEDKATLLLGLVIGAAGLGNTVGIGLGSMLRRVTPALTVVVALLADAAMSVVAALFYGLLAAVALGLTAGVAQAMGKVSLDSTIQTSVPERHRTSAFARSETMLQLSWVVGGFIGIGLPLIPRLGLGVLAGLMVAWTVFVLVRRPGGPAALPPGRGPRVDRDAADDDRAADDDPGEATGPITPVTG
ncbi:MFS transporter [Nocardioides aurantiacus]|uniref:MFS transporter n=1 Tax=Nocardioides aurantiacus TaxID=86796 RepID=A0A3N2CQZ7_9ACTN|nr:MFS transporter [Nocardioides aurantiacus]ROR89957.1 MFS transporter [Nocardioides aurantiacus]